MPYLFDASQETAKRFGAVCTPDFFGYNADLTPNTAGDSTHRARKSGTNARRDLFEAMQLVSQTGQGPKDQIPSMGCSIKWKNQ